MGMEDHELDKWMDEAQARWKERFTSSPDGPMKKKEVDKDNPCQGCVDNWNRICDQYNRAWAQMILIDPIFEPCPLGDKCANQVRRTEQG